MTYLYELKVGSMTKTRVDTYIVQYTYLPLYIIPMSAQYKENKFSIESLSASHAGSQDNTNKTARPNIDHLIKRVLSERRREKKKIR